MNKILITGSNGFIGSKLREYLKNYYQIIEFNGDITKPLNVKKDFDLIIHLAAKTSIPDSIKNPLETFNVNFFGTLNVLELAKNKKMKIIFLSTAGIFEQSSKPLKEDSFIDPKNFYVESKYLAEQLCSFYSKNYDVNCIILRLFNVYGYPTKDGRLMECIIDGLLKNSEIELSSPNPIRDYIHLDDVNNAIKLAIRYKNVNKFEVFNIGSGIGVSVADVLDKISLVYGKKPKVRYTNFRYGELNINIANIDKAKNLLKWEPKINLDEGIKLMIQAYENLG